MAIEIRLLNRFQLRPKTNDETLLDLPIVELAPVSTSNLPHISSISCVVEGEPRQLGAQIQAAYRTFTFKQPIRLYAPQRLRQDPYPLDKPLPGNVGCTLLVIVEYFDSDAAGNPILAIPQTASKSCYLFTPKTEPEIPAIDINKIEPQPAVIVEEKPKPVEKNLNESTDWLAIDFGTSNSTVTLFDASFVSNEKSLPKEQKERLGELLVEWLNSTTVDALAGVSVAEWERFIGDIKKDVEIPEMGTLNDQALLVTIRKIETSLGNRPESFRRAANKKLNHIYHEVFRVPPLSSQNLLRVSLDLGSEAKEIPSELEIQSLKALKVLMGNRVLQNRRTAFSETKGEEINGKFHHSPKRYFGQQRDAMQVKWEGVESEITSNELIQAAWGYLIENTKKYYETRTSGRSSRRDITTAVVTYPAVAPPVVRREIEQMVSALGMDFVKTDYDEAVSVVIFFLWREFGGDLNIGIESFKTRCHWDGKKWSQNVLVLDIGGGTTDLALINLSLEEKDPFERDEDRGAGGRYYVLTPTFIGSSGHLQLGGELITLRIFKLLKVAIADCLLTAVTSGDLECQKLEDEIAGLSDRFLTKDGKYKIGSLWECVDKKTSNPEEDPAYNDALKDAEKILPTKWKNNPSRLQTFYEIWDYAEEIKIEINQNIDRERVVLTEKKISDLLKQSGIDFKVKSADRLNVKINRQQFENAVSPVVEDAVRIAKGLVESRLGYQSENHRQEKVDWLILSGQTCKIYLVEELVKQEFSKYDYFVWNPERVTFVPEFSKMATSVGACYAEKLRQYGFDLEAAKGMLRLGVNQLDIDVKNLFYFLPCSFTLKTQGERDRLIFRNGRELRQLSDRDSIAKTRSDWEGVPLTITIYRQDFDGANPMLWGGYNINRLVRQLGMEEDEFKAKIKVQFEIDQKLQFKLLFCQGTPHSLISASCESLDLKKAIAAASPELANQPIISQDGKLLCDIAVYVIELQTVSVGPKDPPLVFDSQVDYSKFMEGFRYESNVKEQGTGLISKPLPEFPRKGKHTFCFRDPITDRWETIGELSRPGGKSDYNYQYYVTLDDKGILRIHAGEIPYWTSDNPECLKQEGCVFETGLEDKPKEIDENRDPFCGIH
ncbi:acetate and sugar kinases/Hsc70/actin family protein [Aerosakkonema funiforme]|uniref:Molecular chaperone n=2 Tax=Oscillatoriophycideae TaxID=1301283 RepID=A0A926VK66_9CYAN|nr:molecular chaperone [Aerosakkonema funiforme]MBD2183944.1 molecular chaperone [Aerosakkonema funiforme FACHB-1375]